MYLTFCFREVLKGTENVLEHSKKEAATFNMLVFLQCCFPSLLWCLSGFPSLVIVLRDIQQEQV